MKDLMGLNRIESWFYLDEVSLLSGEKHFLASNSHLEDCQAVDLSEINTPTCVDVCSALI